MNQKNLIHLYNSMFDDSESETEIEDSVKDSHEKINGLSRKRNPIVFNYIINIMDDNNMPHKSNENLTQEELNQITQITQNFHPFKNYFKSYFRFFNPKDGDFSIIFKYLKNVRELNESCFNYCTNLRTIIIPNKVTKLDCI